MPIARNPSFTPSPALRADLDLRHANQGITHRLNQIFDRYKLLRGKAPELSESELLVISTALNGSYIEPLFIKHLDDEIEDLDIPGCQEVAKKISEMTLSQRVALIDSIGF